MSEKNLEPDIDPRSVSVAEVPFPDIAEVYGSSRVSFRRNCASGERRVRGSIWTPHLSVTFEHLNSENL
jgi:hypothetical protein